MAKAVKAISDTVDDEKLDEIEHVIETLDTAYLLGEPTIHPLTKKVVSDPDYDKLYGQNGSERALLKKHRPDSSIFKGVTAAKVDFSKASKVVHSPPMTSIDKADGSQVKKYKRLGEWMLDILGRMKISTKYTRDLFKTDGKDDPTFLEDLKTVEAALADLSETKDSSGAPVFVQSLKHDGCAVSITYKKSRINEAGNRPRDGINAASVLEHVKQVTGIPNSLLVPDLNIQIRGEVELRISDFEKVNAEAKAAGEKTYENPRNATAGAMNPLGDPTVARKRKLSFIGYSIIGHDDATYKYAMDRAKWVNKTLKVPFIQVQPFKFADLATIETTVREKLDYGIDGIIIEVNDLHEAELMGNVGDSPTGDPRYKLAWKFAAEKAKAVVKNIRWTTKRTGKVTPVAEFDGVRLAGTTVRNCTIHNARQLIDGGVGIGAEIIVYKAGEIIPYWDETVKVAPKVEYPHNCPSCNAKLDWSATNVDLVCNNDQCSARHVDSLKHYLKTFGVKGIAESTVTTLIEAGLVKTPADFYRLTPDTLTKAGFSEREAILAYARIHMIESPDKEKDDGKLYKRAEAESHRKKAIPLAKFIACLGIPGSGKGTGTSLAAEFGTLDAIRRATAVDFEKSQDIGSKTALTLHDWFSKSGKLIDDLLEHVQIEKPKTGIFTGKVFCFSGSFNPDKEYWIKKVEDEGAKVTTAPSKKTTHFVWGPGSGNKKDAAEQLKKDGIPIQIIEVEDLEKLLGLDKADDRLF